MCLNTLVALGVAVGDLMAGRGGGRVHSVPLITHMALTGMNSHGCGATPSISSSKRASPWAVLLIAYQDAYIKKIVSHDHPPGQSPRHHRCIAPAPAQWPVLRSGQCGWRQRRRSRRRGRWRCRLRRAAVQWRQCRWPVGLYAGGGGMGAQCGEPTVRWGRGRGFRSRGRWRLRQAN